MAWVCREHPRCCMQHHLALCGWSYPNTFIFQVSLKSVQGFWRHAQRGQEGFKFVLSHYFGHWLLQQPVHKYKPWYSNNNQLKMVMHACTHTHTTVLRPSWILFGTTRVSRHQKGKTNLDLLEQEIVSGSGISWAICKSHASIPPLSFLHARCPSCHPTNSVKALKVSQNK